MLMEATKIAEQALVDLAFAQAEIVMTGEKSEHISRALRHIRHAKSCLKAIAPEFDVLPDRAETKAA